MKSTVRILSLWLALLLVLSGCSLESDEPIAIGTQSGQSSVSIPDLQTTDTQASHVSSELYEGYFDEDLQEITVTCLSGTPNAYRIEGSVLTFTALSEDSVYSLSGQMKGNVIIDVGENYKLDLELQGVSIVCEKTNPITVLSGSKVSITAKKDSENYIYDHRPAVTAEEEYAAAIYSMVDLEICGKGSLSVVSAENNGIHGKDDLEVKNLTLTVSCVDNALKGNDSLTVTGGTTTLIASQGDGMKTTNSNVSEKGNQRGTVTISGGNHTIYAACDGIDAAYNVVVDDEATVLSIFTDKYSSYSEEITAVDGENYYVRFTSQAYQYSVRYSDKDRELWVNAEYHSQVSGGRTTYYYYAFPKHTDYSKMQFFIYSSSMKQGQDENYLAATEDLSPNGAYDTFALTASGNSLGYTWTNYTTTVQESTRPGGGGMGGRPGGGGFGGGGMGGMGGMGGGNTDKSDHSTKGIKAANEILISAGTVNVKAYDDALHANNDTPLENNAAPTGNVTISGGVVTVYSNDDGIHADGTLTLTGGTVTVQNSYEGLEGTRVILDGADVSVVSKDDGVNATTTSETGVEIKSGYLYVYASGDGIDANSRVRYGGIVFSGGRTVVISTSGGNSAIDTEQGYSYTGGIVLAAMPSGGMTSESTHGDTFARAATQKSISLNEGDYLTVSVNGERTVTVQMPQRLSGQIIYLGSTSASVFAEASASVSLDRSGVCWEA